jgi:cupin fold WbuC family metalloprotein
MSSKDISSLIYKYENSSRRRHRYCFHQNPKVDLHDIICYDSKTYIPPNKHTGKVESLIILSGTIDFFLFNDSGIVYDYRRLSNFKSGKPFYVRVPPNVWHGLRVVGDEPVIIKETISGPYDSLTLKWANFAPAESANNENGFKWYDYIFNECRDKKIKINSEEIFEKINDTVFRSNQQLVTVSLANWNRLLKLSKNQI